MELYPHQIEGLKAVEGLQNCALYWDMGLGKTFGGSEQMMRFGNKVNLVICQKSKVDDWIEHMLVNYQDKVNVWNLTEKLQFDAFFKDKRVKVGVINYELAFRRPELKKLQNFTLMLDESSMIQNENAKRSKFILKLRPRNVILLSGTPTSGKYEKLWSQLHLLGWDISKKLYWKQYIDTEVIDCDGYPVTIVKGYKNVERLKRKLREHGAMFLKSEEVFDLPEQIHQTIRVNTTREYRKFRKDSIVSVPNDGPLPPADNGEKIWEPSIQLVGGTTLTKMLYERQLCGQYNKEKLEAFRDILESTNDRIIVFYNFNEELAKLEEIAIDLNRTMSLVNGEAKMLEAYEKYGDSVTLIQYQAGAMGLNLQKANRIVYFTPPLSSELFEQSKKRIHRIGQTKTCFYYYLTCRNSIEEKIYKTLEMRKDYTDALFEKGNK